MHALSALTFLVASIPVGSAFAPPTHTDVPPPALPTGCFVNSVLNPMWEISQLHYTDTTLKLVVTNPADESVFHCAGGSDGSNGVIQPTCVTSNGGVGNVRLEFTPETHTLEIEQTWICTDNQQHVPTTFVGTGNTTLIQSSSGNSCTQTTNVRVRASLQSPVTLTPVMPPPPPGHDHPGCQRVSESPSWDISSFQWNTGAVEAYQPEAIIPQYRPAYALHVTLTNSATGQSVSCVQTWGTWAQANLSSNTYLSPFYAPTTIQWQECVGTGEVDRYITNYNTWTNVLLDPDAQRLYVDQTWYCDDEGADHPVQYTANGSAPLPPLSCVPRNTTADSFPFEAVVYNGSTCTANTSLKTNFTVPGTFASQHPLQPYALTLPRPAARHCTADSLDPSRGAAYVLLYAPLQFEYRYYATLQDTGEPGNPVAGRLQFLLWNVGEDVKIECDAWTGKLNPNTTDYDPGYWFDCRESIEVGQSSADPNEGGVRWARVNYDAMGNVLRVNMSWVCDDESPGHNVTFEAFSETKLPALNCTVEDAGSYDQATLCAWPNRWNSSDFSLHFVSYRAY